MKKFHLLLVLLLCSMSFAALAQDAEDDEDSVSEDEHVSIIIPNFSFSSDRKPAEPEKVVAPVVKTDARKVYSFQRTMTYRTEGTALTELDGIRRAASQRSDQEKSLASKANTDALLTWSAASNTPIKCDDPGKYGGAYVCSYTVTYAMTSHIKPNCADPAIACPGHARVAASSGAQGKPVPTTRKKVALVPLSQDAFTKIPIGSDSTARRYPCAQFANDHAADFYADSGSITGGNIGAYIGSKTNSNPDGAKAWSDGRAWNTLISDHIKRAVAGKYHSKQESVDDFFAQCTQSAWAENFERWWAAEKERQAAARARSST